MMNLVVSLGLIAAANVCFSFVIHCYIFLQIGPGLQTDAFYGGLAIPQWLLSVLGGTLFYVMVPLLAGEDENRLSQSVWEIFLIVGGTLGALACGLSVSAWLWIPLLFPGFSDEGLSLCVELTRVHLLGMVFSALSNVLRAAYHARQRFFWPEFSQLTESILGLGALLWALPNFGVYAAAVIYALRALLLTLLLLPGLGKHSQVGWSKMLIQRAWDRIKPLAAAHLYYKSGPVLDRFLTSLAPVGGLSFFYFSQQLYEVANHLVNRAITGPLLPQLAVQAKTGRMDLFGRTYRRRLLAVFAVAIATVLVVLSFAEPLLRLAQQIDDNGVWLFRWITVAFAGFFIGGAIGQVLSSTFYARGDVQTPTRVGNLGFTLGIGLKVLGFKLAGLPGIALGTSFYYIGNAVALYLLLGKKDNDLPR